MYTITMTWHKKCKAVPLLRMRVNRIFVLYSTNTRQILNENEYMSIISWFLMDLLVKILEFELKTLERFSWIDVLILRALGMEDKWRGSHDEIPRQTKKHRRTNVTKSTHPLKIHAKSSKA